MYETEEKNTRKKMYGWVWRQVVTTSGLVMPSQVSCFKLATQRLGTSQLRVTCHKCLMLKNRGFRGWYLFRDRGGTVEVLLAGWYQQPAGDIASRSSSQNRKNYTILESYTSARLKQTVWTQLGIDVNTVQQNWYMYPG